VVPIQSACAELYCHLWTI